MSESIKHQAVKGVIWSAIERFSVQGIQFVLSIIIARLVLPSEYGLIAMLGIFIAIAQSFIDSGFSNALVQKRKRTEVDYSTVFYFNIIVSLVVYLLLYLSAPFIADFYHEPILDKLTKITGLTLIISSFSIVQKAKLVIALDFKSQARVSFLAVIISGIIGILMAWKGYGVWALAVQSILNNLLISIFLWITSCWFPSFIFSFTSFKELFAFGYKLLLGGLFHTIYSNLYTAIIGRYFLPINVGLFSRAQTLSSFPATNITDIVSRAMYPILCDMQYEEERLVATFINYLRQITYIVFPLMMLLIVLSEPLIRVILTDKWLDASRYLSILCLANMWNPIMYVNWQILNVRGRSDLSLKSEIIKKIIAFFILFLTIPLGIEGMCWGLLLYSIIDIIIVIRFVKKVLPITGFMEVKALFPIFVITLVMGGCVYFLISELSNAYSQLFIGGFVGVSIYILLSMLFKFPESSFLKNVLFLKV